MKRPAAAPQADNRASGSGDSQQPAQGWRPSLRHLRRPAAVLTAAATARTGDAAEIRFVNVFTLDDPADSWGDLLVPLLLCVGIGLILCYLLRQAYRQCSKPTRVMVDKMVETDQGPPYPVRRPRATERLIVPRAVWINPSGRVAHLVGHCNSVYPNAREYPTCQHCKADIEARVD